MSGLSQLAASFPGRVTLPRQFEIRRGPERLGASKTNGTSYDLNRVMVGASSNIGIELIQQVANHDHEAFSQLYDQFSSLVFTVAMRMLKVRFDAEDLLQEVFVQIWRRADTYSIERGSPEAWIINITRSRAIDKLRAARRMERSFVLTDDPAGVQSIEDVQSAATDSDTRLTMKSMLADLPEVQRKVLELAYFDGLTQSEIAVHLAEPLGTVKTRMRAGIQRLREIFGTQAA
jgi:RNA polymerase sigma-70 factor, ECF subfamily